MVPTVLPAWQGSCLWFRRDSLEAIKRLVWIGFLLLSLSFAAGFIARLMVSGGKFWFSLLIWFLYAGILVGSKQGLLSGRQLAIATSAAFLLALILLPVIEKLSAHA